MTRPRVRGPIWNQPLRHKSRLRRLIPLTLPLHVEKPAVVDELLLQVLEIVDLVRDCPRTANFGKSGGAESSAPDAAA